LGIQAPVVSCPPEVRKVADEYKDLLGNHYSAFVAALSGAIFGVGNFSEIVRYFIFSPSVSSLSRLYAEEELYPQLNRRHRRKVQSLLKKAKKDPKRFMWAIDDTLIPHWGKGIWGADYWYDHTTNTTVYGHKLLTLGLVDRKTKTLIPVFWEVLHRGIEGFEHLHEKGWEVAIKLLKIAGEEGFPKLTVCTDSWFAGEEFFDALTSPKLGLNYVCEIKSNRKVVRDGKNKDLDIRVDDYFKGSKRSKIFYKRNKRWAVEAVLRFNESKEDKKTVAVANKKSLDKDPFAYYVTNKLTWSASTVWAISRDRWAIEVQFRELKQSFTLGESAVRSQQAVEISISIAMIALTAIRFEQLARVDANEDQHVRPIPAGTIVREYQLQSLIQSISKLASNYYPKMKEKIRARLNPDNISRKPTEKNKAPKIFEQSEVMRKIA
jgi:hypothetical protein